MSARNSFSLPWFVVLMMAACGGRANATQPSFDCATAHQPLAATICSDPNLSTLDLSFAQAYQALRQQVGPVSGDAVRQEAIDFQRNVIQTCNLPPTMSGFSPAPYTGCIAQLYLAQRNVWVGRLYGDAAEEAGLAPQVMLQAQEMLRTDGYLPADATVDGLFGATSRSALTAFQLANQLPPSGFLSRASAASLLQAVKSNLGAAVASVPTRVIGQTAAPVPSSAPSKATLALAKAEAEKAKADAVRAQAEAEKAKAEAAFQMAITSREAAERQAQAQAAADAREKAEALAQARRDASGAAP